MGGVVRQVCPTLGPAGGWTNLSYTPARVRFY